MTIIDVFDASVHNVNVLLDGFDCLTITARKVRLRHLVTAFDLLSLDLLAILDL